MTERPYVTVDFSDSDRSSCDSYYFLTIVVGKTRFIPDHLESDSGYYNGKEAANEAATRIAKLLGIEARLAAR